MNADSTGKPIVVQPPTAIRLSRPVNAISLAMIMLAVAPVQPLAARSWELGTDIYYDRATKTIELTTDPEAFVVELPAGKTEISELFKLDVPGKEVVDQLREKMKESAEYRDSPAEWAWILDDSNALMHFSIEVQVAADGNDRVFEVWIEALDYDSVDLHDDAPAKMYVEFTPNTFGDVSYPPDEVVGWFQNYYYTQAYKPTKYGLRLEFSTNLEEPLAMFIKLHEVPLACSMMVEWWGDYKGSDFGDLAYYNNFLEPENRYAEQGGVGRATGSAADPTAQAGLDYLMEMTGAYSGGQGTIFSEEEAAATSGSAFDPFSDTTYPELEEEANRQEVEQFYDWLGESDEGEALETFGISMAGRNVNQVTAGMTNEQIGDIRTKGLGQLITASELEAASSSPTVKVIFDPSTGVATGGQIPLSRLDFSPMAMGARFHWAEGKPGFGTMQFVPLTGDVIGGEINGTLYSHEARREDGSDAEISIHATFIAAKGAFGCDLPGVDKILK